MQWNEWESQWSKLRREWQSNFEKYDKNDGRFDDNLIAIFEFPNSNMSQNAYLQIEKEGGRKPPCAAANCKAVEFLNEIRVHYRCPDLPMVIKICVSFGGVLSEWEKSRMEAPLFNTY